jgi:WD40 repeat protein
MPLTPGQSLSFYEILGALGAGGMGEVYRARDTRLEREVAIKVLPEHFAEDEDRLRRFEREAKTLASLNHPNVAGVHGIDQVDDSCFIALELVPGDDLATRVAKGALPVDEALDVCRQIAEGLEAAHEAGVIHRDLKPANVRITPEGVVKLLDFGLAKPLHVKTGSGGTSTAESDSFLMTEEGVVLGTPTYMSPEQARGKPVDRRTDVWAFGCVLYECLTGERAYRGDSFTDVVAAIVGEEPDWSALPPLAPRVEELLRRCLTKDPRSRLRDAGEARVQLALALGEQQAGTSPRPASVPTGAPSRVAIGVAAIAGLVAGGALMLALRPSEPDAASAAPAKPFHVAFERLPVGPYDPDLAISPDGTRLAWTQLDGLHVRRLDSLTSTVLVPSGFETPSRRTPPRSIAWSPDGRQLAYVSDKVLWRVPLDGGPATQIGPADALPQMAGSLVWTIDDRLVYRDWKDSSLVGLSALGGEREELVQVNVEDTKHFDGAAPLPDGSVLVLRHREGQDDPDAIALLRDGELRDVLVLPGWDIGLLRFGAGQLIIERKADGANSLWTVPFSSERGEALGEPSLLAENASAVSIASDGTLAYLRQSGNVQSEAVWVDLQGRIEGFGRPRDGDFLMSVASHDRRQVLTTAPGAGSTIWSYDIDRGVSTPLLKLESDVLVMAGTLPDGRILGMIFEDGQTVALSPDGRGDQELIAEGMLASINRAGTYGLVIRGARGGDQGIDVLDLADGTVAPYLAIDVRGPAAPHFSPDGRFVLYANARTGESEVYLTGFPSPDRDWPVSTDGGSAAWFDEHGDTIYFTRGGVRFGTTNDVWSVTLQREPEVRLGVPERLFELEDEEVVLTDFHPTEQRFLGFRRVRTGERSIVVHAGWAEGR